MKLKKHKVILRLPTTQGEICQESVFLWDFASVAITVKKLEPSGMYRVSKMHRPDARVIWGYLIRKGFKIIDVTHSIPQPSS